MALTANRNLKFFVSRELVSIPVEDNVRIFKGAYVGRNATTGYARPLVAGDAFLGVAYAEADNTIDGHTAGGIEVRLQQNVDVIDGLFGVTQSDIGKPAFASADDAISLTGTSRIGRVVGSPGANQARIRLQPLLETATASEAHVAVTLPASGGLISIDQLNRELFIANTGAVTVTLPPAVTAGAGAWFRLSKLTPTGVVTIDGDGSDTISGSLSNSSIDAQYDSLTLTCTGGAWVIVARDLS